jgi:hypothetical protein
MHNRNISRIQEQPPSFAKLIFSYLSTILIFAYVVFSTGSIIYAISNIEIIKERQYNKLIEIVSFNNLEIGVLTSQYWFSNSKREFIDCNPITDISLFFPIVGSIIFGSMLLFMLFFGVHVLDGLRSRHRRCSKELHFWMVGFMCLLSLAIIGTVVSLLIMGVGGMFKYTKIQEFKANDPNQWQIIDKCSMSDFTINKTQYSLSCNLHQLPLKYKTGSPVFSNSCSHNVTRGNIVHNFCCADITQQLNVFENSQDEYISIFEGLALKISWIMLFIIIYWWYIRHEAKDRNS